MRRLLAAALAVCLTAALAAAASARPSAPPTKQPGTLIVGFDLPAGDFIKGTAAGSTIRNPRGFEVDLVNAIAKKIGIQKVQWLRATFTGLFRPGPKPFDVAFEQITITQQRKKVVDFSAPYFDANQGILIAKGVPAPKSLADLAKLQTCSQATTTGLDYLQTKLRPAKKPLSYQQLSAAFLAVSTGQCQALMMDVPIVAGEVKQHPTKYGGLVGQVFTKEQYGALFEKDNPLRPFVSRAINELRKDGTIGRLQKKWFNIDFSTITTLE